ncbi:MAG: Trk system potassium transporter TrkA, partial [Gammaproteobacteria bacterium]
LRDIKLPPGATIGAIMRGDKLMRIDGGAVIEEGDHLIIFVIDKRRIADVEKLFQVSAAFF